MNWVEILSKIVFKSLAFLPCFFTVINYFTVLKPEQRTEPIGWIFLAATVFYFAIALALLIKNW